MARCQFRNNSNTTGRKWKECTRCGMTPDQVQSSSNDQRCLEAANQAQSSGAGTNRLEEGGRSRGFLTKGMI